MCYIFGWTQFFFVTYRIRLYYKETLVLCVTKICNFVREQFANSSWTTRTNVPEHESRRTWLIFHELETNKFKISFVKKCSVREPRTCTRAISGNAENEKRGVLKGRHSIATEDILEQVRAEEAKTQAKRKKSARRGTIMVLDQINVITGNRDDIDEDVDSIETAD